MARPRRMRIRKPFGFKGRSSIIISSPARKRRRRAKRNPIAGRHRPVVIYTKGRGFRRPKRSRLFKRGRKYRINRRSYRRNGVSLGAVKSALTVRNLVHLMSLGGGFLVGMQLSAFLAGGAFFGMGGGTMSNAMWQKARPVQGLVHVVLGTIVGSQAKQPVLKDLAVGMAASGAYDVLTQLLGMAGIKAPGVSGWIMNRPNQMGWNTRAPMRRPNVVVGGFGDMSDVFSENA